MSKHPAPTEAEREIYLQDLRRVGPSKPVGYLPLYTIRDFAHFSSEAVAVQATEDGLTAIEFGPKRCCIKSGALYVYDPAALAQLLLAHAEVLEANGFPIDPDRFVAHIAKTWFPQDHPTQSVKRSGQPTEPQSVAFAGCLRRRRRGRVSARPASARP